MSRRTLIILIGIVLAIMIAAVAFRLLDNRTTGEPDIRATQEASVTDCVDLYPAGSPAYKACIEGQ